jgi:hypothetical protein
MRRDQVDRVPHASQRTIFDDDDDDVMMLKRAAAEAFYSPVIS